MHGIIYDFYLKFKLSTLHFSSRAHGESVIASVTDNETFLLK